MENVSAFESTNPGFVHIGINITLPSLGEHSWCPHPQLRFISSFLLHFPKIPPQTEVVEMHEEAAD